MQKGILLMRLSELRTLLQGIKAQGYVPTERNGPTGVGHTLERRLGLAENNLPIPDIGGRVEVKATRSNWNNLITLFTFNRAVWSHSQKETIERWGYVDSDGQPALRSTVSTQEPNALGLQLFLADDAGVHLVHVPSGTRLATWDIYHMIGKFVTKFGNLLFVRADSQMNGGPEMFHYYWAAILSEPSAAAFRSSFDSGKVVIDVRMYLKPNGAVRNHGTGFRIMEADLPTLFGKVNQIV